MIYAASPLRLMLASVLTALLVVFFAIGCRAAPPLPNPPSPVDGNPTPPATDLILWHSETGATRATLEALAKDFHTAYPDLNVTPVYVGNDDDLSKQVTAAIALGQTPDLMLANRRQVVNFARQRGLLPLNALISDPEIGLRADDMADLLKWMTEEGKFPEFKDQVFSFPFDQEAMVLFYNPILLRKAGYTNPPTTWDEFADQASKTTQDQNYGWAIRSDPDALEAILVSRGSAFLDNAEKRALFNERAGVGSLSLASELVKSGSAKLADSDDSARNDFVSGNAAFLVGWMSELEQLKEEQKKSGTNFDIGLANLPQLDPTDPYMFTRGYSFALFKMPPERARSAWFFVRWMTAPQQSARWVRSTDALPLRESALTFLALDLPTNPRFRQIYDSFNGKIPRFVVQPANRQIGLLEDLAAQLWTQALEPKADISAILDAAAARANQILAANSSP